MGSLAQLLTEVRAGTLCAAQLPLGVVARGAPASIAELLRLTDAAAEVRNSLHAGGEVTLQDPGALEQGGLE